ncbi:MAG: radical SAM protein, partial [Deltaproteobacteria bacterium]|nr:radical SAM protein [Deltaproteobacteria bacterium]
TVSGGEALVQWEFARAILKRSQEEGIHTCLETALHCRPEVLEVVYPFVDLVITDLKHMSPERHREHTGVGADRIRKNLIKTIQMGKPVIVRIPVVPGYNDDEDNIRATAVFIAEGLGNQVLQVQLLPYRPLGIEKYASLGLDYPMEGDAQPDRATSDQAIRSLVSLMTSYGVPAVAGASSTGLSAQARAKALGA